LDGAASVAPFRLYAEQEVQVLCAGINRHEVENARVSRERISDLLGPEFCARRCEALSEA